MRAAIFDLDGTILDSMGVWEWVDEVFFRRRGMELPADYGDAVAGMNFYRTACYTVEHYGLPETPEALMAEWHELAFEAYRDQVRPKPCVPEYLRALKARGVKLALATASEERLYRAALARDGLMELFDAVALVDEVPRGKEFPDVYELAARRLGETAQDCVVFEDLPLAVRGAQKGGFYTVGVADAYARAQREELIRTADRFVEGFDVLLAELESMPMDICGK